jgi:hypothetical protein
MSLRLTEGSFMPNCELSKNCHGVLLMIIGSILLLNTLGVLKEITNIIICTVAGAMLVYGFLLCEGPRRIRDLMKRDDSSQ